MFLDYAQNARRDGGAGEESRRFPTRSSATRAIAELFANKSFLDPSVKGVYDPEFVELIEKHGLMPEVDPVDLAINLRDDCGNSEWIVSENGMGVEGEEKFRGPDGAIQDDYRIDFIKERLTELARGIDEGSNCIGYHLWTFIDCRSWLNAYKNRYGLVELDLKT